MSRHRHVLAEDDEERTCGGRRSQTAPSEREVAGVLRYQRLFARFIRQCTDDDEDGKLRAELVAATGVTSHNHVLRR